MTYLSANWPWLLGIVLAIVWFTFFEYRAMRHPERGNTLSRFVYDIGQRIPLSLIFMGMFIGGLLVHFFWHWCPVCNESIGLLVLPPYLAFPLM